MAAGLLWERVAAAVASALRAEAMAVTELAAGATGMEEAGTAMVARVEEAAAALAAAAATDGGSRGQCSPGIAPCRK